MRSPKLIVTLILCALLIPVMILTIGCSQEEQAQGVEGESPLGEAAERATGETNENAAGETTELASNEAGERSGGEEGGEHGGERSVGRGEEGHGEEGEEEHGEEGEESGTRYSKSESVDVVRRGVQLKLRYDESSSTFIGTIKNVSNEPVKKARVEVHLSNGVELGPTTPVDLAPGQQADVKLSAENQTFTMWETHAEVGG